MTDPDNREPSGNQELEAALNALVDPDNLLRESVENEEINPDKLAAYFLDKIRNLLILQTPDAEESLCQSVDDLEQVIQKSPQLFSD